MIKCRHSLTIIAMSKKLACENSGFSRALSFRDAIICSNLVSLQCRIIKTGNSTDGNFSAAKAASGPIRHTQQVLQSYIIHRSDKVGRRVLSFVWGFAQRGELDRGEFLNQSHHLLTQAARPRL